MKSLVLEEKLKKIEKAYAKAIDRKRYDIAATLEPQKLLLKTLIKDCSHMAIGSN